MSEATTVNPDSSVYYQAGYWNQLEQVREYLNRRATDDPALDWSRHLLKWRGGPFAKALILNCGNGWVERDLLAVGLVKEAVGIDFIDDLLDTARDAAGKDNLPLRYYQMDTNTAEFPEGDYDLVVNFAAAHHIARLDRVFRRVAELLPEDGVFVSWDYIGAHRNQYPTAQWKAVWETNQRLPEDMRQELSYAHAPTMIHGDPTEAVHSELIVSTMRRYFDTVYYRGVGGALAYPLLTFNEPLLSRDPEEVVDLVGTILDADAEYTDRDPESNTLFAYLIAQPNKAALTNTAQLTEWAREEDEREAAAARNGGAYYPPTFLADIYQKLHTVRDELIAKTAELQAAVAAAEAASATAAAAEAAASEARALARRPLRANPALRAAGAKVPGARPVYRWLRAMYHRLRD